MVVEPYPRIKAGVQAEPLPEVARLPVGARPPVGAVAREVLRITAEARAGPEAQADQAPQVPIDTFNEVGCRPQLHGPGSTEHPFVVAQQHLEPRA